MTGGSFRERLRRRAARWGLIAAMGLCGVAGIVPPVGERARAAEVAWRWSHPEPHGNNLAEMVYRAGVYAHVTDHGGVYVSTNRVMWQRRETGTRKDLRAAAFFGDRLVVTGEEGTVLWSDDAVTFHAGVVVPPTVDWFEGVAASDSLLVAVGDNGAVYRSTDGKAWTRAAEGVFGEWLIGAAYGAGVFVAVGEGGLIASSTNGVSWVRQRSGVTVDLTRVVYGDGRFLAVGDAGGVVTSVNGVNWTVEASIGSTSPLATAALSPGERLVAGEAALALRRTVGVWQNQLSADISPSPAPEWNYAAAVWDGARYLVGGRTGVILESYRTNAAPFENATFWLRQDESPRNWLWDMAWVGGTYLAVGDQATVLSSASGISWTLEAVPEAAEGAVFYGVGGSPQLALVVGSGGLILRSAAGWTNLVNRYDVEVGGVTRTVTTTNRVSLLGVVWDSVEPRPTTNTLQGVAWNDGRFVVVGGDGEILTGRDGTNWIRSLAGGKEFLSSVAGFGGAWVACGSRGAIYTSPDGEVWTRRNSGTDRWVYRVGWVGSEWMALGEGGLVLTSQDGVQWTSRTSGTTSWLTGFASIGDSTYVCGTQGTVLRSTNRVDWETVPTLTGKALYGMASRGSQCVVGGAEGVILRAITEASATPVAISGYVQFRDAVPGIEALTFEGLPEQRFLWQSGADLGDWDRESELVLDANGVVVVGREAAGLRRFHRAAPPP